jgi:hypothetical protein
MKNWLWFMALVGACLLVTAGTVTAAPLVTGDLSVYFDFDEPFTDVVPDLSDNGIQAVDAAVEGRVYHSETAIRGGGAAVFDSGGHFLPDVDPETIDKEWFPDDYLDLDGPNVDPTLLPGKTFTISVWVKLTRYSDLCDPTCAKDSTQGIFEVRSSDGSFVTHFEARSDGKLRGKIRDQFGGDLVSTQVFINGDPTSGPEWPDDEWFHYARPMTPMPRLKTKAAIGLNTSTVRRLPKGIPNRVWPTSRWVIGARAPTSAALRTRTGS